MSATQNFCPQCGSERQGTLRFCSSCGFDYWKAAQAESSASQATQAPAVAAAAPTTESAKDEKKSTRTGCITLGVIALIAIAIFASMGNNPSGTGDAGDSPSPGAPEQVTETDGDGPEASPTVPASPIATLEPEPAFAAIALTGTGSSVPRFDIPVDTAAIAEISHTGASNFAVWTLDEAGAQQDLLVNTIGNYAGTVLFDEATGSHSVAFDVEADGPWSITVKPVTEAFEWNGTEQLAGSGDDVAILNPASSGLKTVTLVHDGDGNFAIWAYGPMTDLIVNEIGPYNGEVLLPDGTFLFEITANGPWSITPPQ